MNSSYNKQLLNIIKKIHKELRSFKKTQLNYVFLINELIYLNLKVENILFDNSFSQKNPTPIIKKELNNLLSKVVSFKNFKDFDKNIFIKKKKMESRKNTQNSFSKTLDKFYIKAI